MQKLFILWWLILFLYVCNTFVTLNMDVAIVSMVRTQQSDLEMSTIVCPNTSSSLIRKYLKDTSSSATNAGILHKTGYDWSEADQNSVLSGYYWLNYFSIMPGGILSHKYGSKIVIGVAQLVSSTMSSLIPIAAGYGPRTVSWIRAMQGLLSFMSVPAGLFSIMGNWCPPHERSKFGTSCIIGSAIGMSLGSFLFGYLGQYFYWTWIFHLTSVCGMIWTVLWYFLVYDSPDQHPSISVEEKTRIQNSLKHAICRTKTSIPWKGIITSVPFLICVLTVGFLTWAWVLVTTYMPKYLKSFYGLSSNEIGIITGVPCFLAGILPLGVAYYCDLVIKKNILTLTGCRKLCTFLGPILSLTPLLIIAFAGCNLTLAVICLMSNIILRTISSFGAPLVIFDLSPKFCGVLEAFAGTSSSILTFVLSAILNYYSSKYDVEWLWKMAFLCTASCGIFVGGIFLMFGSSKVQQWNFKGDNDNAERNQLGNY